MKKYLLPIAMVALTATAANAQILYGYSFSASTADYTPLGDEATVLYTAPAPTDDKLYSDTFYKQFFPAPAEGATTVDGIDIGFTFPYCDQDMNYFAVAGGGYVMVNDVKEIPYDDTTMRFWFNRGSGNWIGVCSNMGQGCSFATEEQQPTVIKYALQGEEGARKLVVEYENAGFAKNLWGDSYQISYQVILHENGDIDIAYQSFDNIPGDVESVRLRDIIKLGSEFICTSGDDFESATFIFNENALITVNSNTPGNQLHHIAYPEACQAPTVQPTDLVLEATSLQVLGTYTPVEGADTYLVVYSTEALTELPTDGVTYSAGDQFGNATVAYYGDKSIFSFDADFSTNYIVTVFAAGAYGSHGPAYNTVSPLTATITTKPAPVNDFAVVATGPNSITVDVDAPEGLNVLIAYTPFVLNDNGGGRGLFGTLEGEYKVGDAIAAVEGYTHYGSDFQTFTEAENGGIVAYVGPAAKGIVIDNLPASTGYYLAAATYNADMAYTSEIAQATAATYLQAPYSGMFAEVPLYSLPQGWTASETTVSESDDVPNSWKMEVQAFINYYGITRGSQVLQLEAKPTSGFSATKGLEMWAQPQPVIVNDDNTIITFTYGITYAPTRNSTFVYEKWAEGDIMALRVSADGGATWTDANVYTAADHVSQFNSEKYATISADLTPWKGQTVQVRWYFKTYITETLSLDVTLEEVKLEVAQQTADVPVVSVDEIYYNAAKATWTSEMTNFKLSYAPVADDGEEASAATVVKVSDAKEYTITGLTANTTYTVKVCSAIAEGLYGEWSEPLTFTTADWPALPIVALGSVGYDTAELSWNSSLSNFEVSYSPVAADEETPAPTVVTVEGAHSYTITGLTANTTYSVAVRGIDDEGAYTEWSDAITFTTEDWPAIDAPTLEYTMDEQTGIVVLNWTAVEEIVSYEVNVRTADATEWEAYTDLAETTYTLNNLLSETQYICRVRAHCTHDRTTDWSETVRFTTPVIVTSGIQSIMSDIANGTATIYDLQGRRVNNPDRGLYIINGKKVLLKK